jgi:hypothetical protein
LVTISGGDPNADETEMLIAEDLASLRAEATGSISTAAAHESPESSASTPEEQDLLP